MATFVLVHGAFEAGWIWKWTAQHLRDAGHEVLTPTLTGLGGRSHLLSPNIGLDTHISDVLGVLQWEELQNVTLVGHSYGGIVVTGVADKAHKRIGSLVYLDSLIPENGKALMDLWPAERVANTLKSANKQGQGWHIPLPAALLQHVTDPKEIAILKERCTPQPLATFTQKLNTPDNNHLKIKNITYILSSKFQPNRYTECAEKARHMGWSVEELDTHHFTMLSLPQETANILKHHAT